MNELLKMDLYLLEKVKDSNLKKINLEDTNIPSSYALLFIKYSINNELESLKRALFIQWYAIVEPMQFTGIGELNMEYQKMNVYKIHKMLLNNNHDPELLTMFNHYYHIANWYFDNFIDFKPFMFYPEISPINIVTKDRGIMGEYWNSILNNNQGV